MVETNPKEIKNKNIYVLNTSNGIKAIESISDITIKITDFNDGYGYTGHNFINENNIESIKNTNTEINLSNIMTRKYDFLRILAQISSKIPQQKQYIKI